MRDVCGLKGLVSAGDDLFGVSIVDGDGGEHVESRMIVVVVVPGKEFGAVDQSLVVRCESIREIGLILEGFELAFGKGIIV